MPKSYQNQGSAKSRLVYDGRDQLFAKFIFEDTAIPAKKGALVALSAADTVKLAEDGETPIGYIAVVHDADAGNPVNRDYVTVALLGRDVTYANATEPVNVGALVQQDGTDGDGVPEYANGVAGNFCAAIALTEAAAAGDEFKVLLLNSPIKI